MTTAPTPTPTPSRALVAAVTGLGTAGYYAVPDLLASRTARGWARAACLAVVAAASVPDARAARAAWSRAQADGEAAGLPDALTMPLWGKVLAGTAVGGLLAGVVRLVVVVERWVYRRGQTRAAAGRRLPHARDGLLLGALAAGLALPPNPR